MHSRLTRRLLAAGITLSCLAVGVGSASASDPKIDLDPSSGSDQAAATQALADAKALFSASGSTSQRRAAGARTHGLDATMVLRNLVIHAKDLPTSAERTEARRILARPTNGDAVADEPKYDTSNVGTDCGTHVCVHWIEDSSSNHVPGSDGDLSTIPTQVTRTLSTMEHVYSFEVGDYGYQAPVSDIDSSNNGDTGSTTNNAKVDIYLGDTGKSGLYGYCTTDDPNATGDFSGVRAVSAYCVLDNDYKASQFPTNTPLENLEVTAAHEFFHAVQFSYDYLDDEWFMEGTAAWMEDQVYTDVNDNLQYLEDQSPQTDPYVPLDYANYSDDPDVYYSPYGSWVFWRFLSERAGSGSSDDPSIVRQVWEQARSRYSTSALSAVLAARGSSFGDWFTAFGTWSTNPATYFREGSSYPKPDPDASYTLSSSKKSIATHTTNISHMARRFYTFKPGSSLGSASKLTLHLNMANTSTGSMAQAVVHLRSGGLTVHKIALSSSGYAASTFGFNPSTVSYIKVDLINASTKFKNCGDYPNDDAQLSCHGDSVDDYESTRYNASVTR